MRTTLFICALLALVLIIYSLPRPNTHRPAKMDAAIKKLLRQAARWSIASQQDTSPIIALLHGNYGAAYLWALTDIASDSEIYKVTGVDVKTLTAKIVAAQDLATQRVSGACKNFKGDIDEYLMSIAGNS